MSSSSTSTSGVRKALNHKGRAKVTKNDIGRPTDFRDINHAFPHGDSVYSYANSGAYIELAPPTPPSRLLPSNSGDEFELMLLPPPPAPLRISPRSQDQPPQSPLSAPSSQNRYGAATFPLDASPRPLSPSPSRGRPFPLPPPPPIPGGNTTNTPTSPQLPPPSPVPPSKSPPQVPSSQNGSGVDTHSLGASSRPLPSLESGRYRPPPPPPIPSILRPIHMTSPTTHSLLLATMPPAKRAGGDAESPILQVALEVTAPGSRIDDRRPELNLDLRNTPLIVANSSPEGGEAEIAEGRGLNRQRQMPMNRDVLQAIANFQQQMADAAAAASEQPNNDTHNLSTSSRPRHVQYQSESSRRESYTNWIHGPLVSKLVEAGFFYEGPLDLVTCFCCGVNLKDWHPMDDPFVRHARWSKDCSFMLNVKGSDFIAAVEIAMAEISGSVGNMHAVSALMAAQRLPNESHQAVAREVELQPAISSAAQASVKATSTKSKLDLPSENKFSEVEKLRDQLTCKICMDSQVAIFFRPCGHLCVCQECAKDLTICPICRSKLQEKHLIFLP